jgi:hypothetical protein
MATQVAAQLRCYARVGILRNLDACGTCRASIPDCQAGRLSFSHLDTGLAVYLPLWWLTQGLGNHGLWLAFLASSW